jgi:hypothetical protein
VETIYAFLLEIFRYVAAHGQEIMSVVEEAERDMIARGTDPKPDDFVGVNYGVPRRASDGSLVFDWPVHYLEDTEIVAYDRPSIKARRIPGRRLQTYKTAHYARFIPTVSVTRPFAYLVTVPEIAQKLQQHNVELATLTAPVDLDVEAYVVMASEKTTSPDICTGIDRFETVLTTRPERRRVHFDPGTLVVPTAQRLGNLVVYLLEPESDDGLARWEFFDAATRLGEPFAVYRVSKDAAKGLKTQAVRTSQPPGRARRS